MHEVGHSCVRVSPFSERCSVFMMSKTWCNFLLASFGASSSSVMIHPLGVVQMVSLWQCLFCFRTCIPARNRPTECPCYVLGLAAIRGLRISDCRDSTVGGLPSPSTRASVDPPPTQQTCQLSCTETSASAMLHPRVAGSLLASTTALHAAVSTPNVSSLHLLSGLTPTAWPTDSML